jgi:uncharacterized repeat protein (TIGR01451 family)
LTADEIVNGEEVFFTIRFQNTGTYLAERVRITDQIDTTLNFSTLRFVAASHEVTSFALRPGGLLEVVFENINLPDSLSNEPESHGFVAFAIQRNKNYRHDDEVKNIAAIYFDFNEPIFTNEVIFKVAEDPIVSTKNIEGKENRELSIYPNPTNDIFTVSTAGKAYGSGILKILDSNGKILKVRKITDLHQLILFNASGFAPGMYIVQVSTQKVTLNGKIIIVK